MKRQGENAANFRYLFIKFTLPFLGIRLHYSNIVINYYVTSRLETRMLNFPGNER